MTKDIEKLSAWYDGEISQEDFDKGLENLGSSSESKKILHEYAILSELMQRKSKPQVSNLAQLIDYLPLKNPWLSNVFIIPVLTASGHSRRSIIFLLRK